MLGTYVIYLDIRWDDYDDYDDGESSDEDYYEQSTDTPLWNYERLSKYVQRPSKNCEKVHF